MRHASALVLLLLAPAMGGAGLPVPGAEAVGGAYRLRFNLNVASTLPARAVVTCKARIIPDGAGEANPDGELAGVPAESATGVAEVNGATAVCAVEIPFSWTVNNAWSGARLSYEIDAISVAGSLPVVVRSSAERGVAVAFPPAGGTENLSFNVTL